MIWHSEVMIIQLYIPPLSLSLGRILSPLRDIKGIPS